MRKDLQLMTKCYDLGEKLNLSDSEIDDFMSECKEKNIEGSWEDLSLILEKGIELTEKLGDIYNSCELNKWYENFDQKLNADRIGLKVYLNTREKENIIVEHILVELTTYEVCNKNHVDEIDNVYDWNELNLVIDHVKNLIKEII